MIATVVSLLFVLIIVVIGSAWRGERWAFGGDIDLGPLVVFGASYVICGILWWRDRSRVRGWRL